MPLPEPKIRSPRAPKPKKYLNIFLHDAVKGKSTKRVEVIEEVADGVFLHKMNNGKAYGVSDAKTGMQVGWGRTQKEAKESYKSHIPSYEKVKKNKGGLYHNGPVVNKKTKDGWQPVNAVFPKMEVRKYEKEGKGGRYRQTFQGEDTYFSDKYMQNKLKEKASSDPYIHPTIRKVYGVKGEITKIVQYSKGNKLTKESMFRPGKSKKGEKLISKTFIK